MQQQSVTHSNFVIEKKYPTNPERVFAAFADPVKKRRWYAEADGRTSDEFTPDFRESGTESSSSRLGEDTPFPGVKLANRSHYLDIVPGRRIVFAYTMTVGDRRISASLATVELLPVEGGTTLIFTEQSAFFEGADGAQMREAGWRELLESLAKELADS